MIITDLCILIIGAVIGYYIAGWQIRRENTRNKPAEKKPKLRATDSATELARAIERQRMANFWNYDGSEQKEYDELW